MYKWNSSCWWTVMKILMSVSCDHSLADSLHCPGLILSIAIPLVAWWRCRSSTTGQSAGNLWKIKLFHLFKICSGDAWLQPISLLRLMANRCRYRSLNNDYFGQPVQHCEVALNLITSVKISWLNCSSVWPCREIFSSFTKIKKLWINLQIFYQQYDIIGFSNRRNKCDYIK